VLIADDDRELCGLLARFLEGEGFAVDVVHDGAAAVRRAAPGPSRGEANGAAFRAPGGGIETRGHPDSGEDGPDRPDILVLDVMLPELNGFEALKHIRAISSLPILMLTARDEDIDRILGLEIGADDYLVKPCNPRELAARLRAILRRGRPTSGQSFDAGSGPAAPAIELGGIRLEPSRRRVHRNGKPVTLTSTEFSVLETLMQRAGQVVPRAVLTEEALGRRLARFDRSIDMHVSNLRRKLAPEEAGPGQSEPRIETVRGVGYLFVI